MLLSIVFHDGDHHHSCRNYFTQEKYNKLYKSKIEMNVHSLDLNVLMTFRGSIQVVQYHIVKILKALHLK